jgi:serine/threonine-protein kinase
MAAAIVADAAVGVHAAHGLLHEALTPHRIFVTYDGATKQVGLEELTPANPLMNPSFRYLSPEATYLSPEAMCSGAPAHRANVFALGVVLWELLTGRLLFARDSDYETVVAVRACVVPKPSSIAAHVPPALDAIARTALARDERERFPTTHELAEALRGFMGSEPEMASADVGGVVRRALPEHFARREALLRACSA